MINVSYCPRKSLAKKFLDELDFGIDYAVAEQKKIILIGDYNINYLETDAKALIDLHFSPYGLKIVNKKYPTRLNERGNDTLLDYTITDLDGKCHTTTCESYLPSDHLLTSCSFHVKLRKKRNSRRLTIRSKKNFNPLCYRQDLASANWSIMYQQSNAEEMMAVFCHIVDTILDKHAPLKEIYVRPKLQKLTPSWFTEELRTANVQKKNAFEKFKVSGNPQDYTEFKRLRNRYTNMAKYSKAKVTTNAYNNATNKGRWKILNEMRNSNHLTSEIQCLQDSTEKIQREPCKIAELLNDTFLDLGKYIGPNTDSTMHSTTTTRSTKFNFRFVSEKECFDTVSKLQANKPLGPSTIPAWALIAGQAQIVPHLTFLINSYITSSTFPAILKLADVTPIYKKGNRIDPTNYRPISVTAAL